MCWQLHDNRTTRKRSHRMIVTMLIHLIIVVMTLAVMIDSCVQGSLTVFAISSDINSVCYSERCITDVGHDEDGGIAAGCGEGNDVWYTRMCVVILYLSYDYVYTTRCMI